MKKYLAAILICVILASVIQGLRGEAVRTFQIEKFVYENDTNVAGQGNTYTLSLQYHTVSANDCFSPNKYHFNICEIPVTSAISVWGIIFSKTIRFISPIQVLSSTNTPLLIKNAKSTFSHYNFVRFSSKYFLYALRRIII